MHEFAVLEAFRLYCSSSEYPLTYSCGRLTRLVISFVHYPGFYPVSLFVVCASRQTRVSLSSFPWDLIPQILLIFIKSNKILSKNLHISKKSSTFVH